MNSSERLTALGVALVAVGVGGKLKLFEGLGTPSNDSLLSHARAALHAYLHPRTPSPTPLKSNRPHSAFSIDIPSLSRCSSALRLETERINRMSGHCQALERKSQCLELRNIRQSQQKQAYLEDTERREGAYQAELAFRQRQLEEEKASKEQEKTAQRLNLQEQLAAKKLEKAREKAIRQDELSRSTAKLSLSQYAKERADEERRRDRLEKAKDWREFVEAKKKVMREERENYGDIMQKDLAFNLNQAVSRNQAIISQIRKSGYLQL